MRSPLAFALVLVVACGVDGASQSLLEAEPTPDASADAQQASQPDDTSSDAAVAPAVVDASDGRGDSGEQSSASDAGGDAGTAPARVIPDASVLRLDFTNDVLPLCSGCHQKLGGVKPAVLENVFVDELYLPSPQQGTTSSCNGIRYVTAHSLPQSYLYTKLTPASPCGQHAPIDGLTPEILQELADWIMVAPWETDGGAP